MITTELFTQESRGRQISTRFGKIRGQEGWLWSRLLRIGSSYRRMKILGVQNGFTGDGTVSGKGDGAA